MMVESLARRRRVRRRGMGNGQGIIMAVFTMIGGEWAIIVDKYTKLWTGVWGFKECFLVRAKRLLILGP